MWFLVLAVLLLLVTGLAIFLPKGRSHDDEAPTVRGRMAGRD